MALHQDKHLKLKRNYGIGKEVDDWTEITFGKKKMEPFVEQWE